MATIRVGREALLKVLESVSPGLSTRELLEQSSCYVFTGGQVFTFNDEVACYRKSPLAIEGAVKAKPLVDLLSKMVEDDVEIEQAEGELIVSGKRRKAGIRMEEEVRLNIEVLEEPETWRKLPKDFSDAIAIVHSCASSEASQFVLTCVHIHPDYVEACDRFQIARYPLDTGVEEEVLVRADSIKKICGFDMTEVSETGSWIHFRNPAGLTIACRRYVDEYHNLDAYITPKGTTAVSLPGGLDEVVAKAEIFSGENAAGNLIRVDLRSDRIVITGEGASGWFKEMKKVNYKGSPIQFLISPKLLLEVTSKSEQCGVSRERLFIDSGKFVYASCTVADEPVVAVAASEED
jgi:DNA polymerase III sliding clamp (beta) subunit (PCNA family)